MVWDFMGHNCDLLLNIMNGEMPKTIFGIQNYTKYKNLYDHLNVLFNYKTSVSASIHIKRFSNYGFDSGIEILGTEGKIISNNKEVIVTTSKYTKMVTENKIMYRNSPYTWLIHHNASFLSMIEHFIDIMNNPKLKTITPKEDVIKGAIITDATYKAVYEKRIIEL